MRLDRSRNRVGIPATQGDYYGNSRFAAELEDHPVAGGQPGMGERGDVGIGSRAERVVVITAGLVLAPWGVLPWAIALLTATAWITVVQRVLHVRKQLLEANK